MIQESVRTNLGRPMIGFSLFVRIGEGIEFDGIYI